MPSAQEAGIALGVAAASCGLTRTQVVVSNLNLTPDNIQTGLNIAIMRGYTALDDPVVAKVRQLLELMRTENMTVSEAAYSVEIPLDILAELGRLVQEERVLSLQSVYGSGIKA